MCDGYMDLCVDGLDAVASLRRRWQVVVVVVFRWGLYHRRLVQDALVRPMPIYGRMNCIHTLVITVTSRFLIIN